MLSRGDAGGVFQFEGQGMRDVLRQMRPDRFEDLIAAVALYRPGPMANIPDYCRRKHGEAWEAPHPELREHPGRDLRHHGLPGTGDADRPEDGAATAWAPPTCCAARWARRSAPRWRQQRQIFTDGAMARGIPEAKATEVFDLMAKFADYGFNKIATPPPTRWSPYQTAWMKANHPVAFLAACMDLALSNTDKLAALRQEARAHGHSRAAARHQPLRRAISRSRRRTDGTLRSATRWRR